MQSNKNFQVMNLVLQIFVSGLWSVPHHQDARWAAEMEMLKNSYQRIALAVGLRWEGSVREFGEGDFKPSILHVVFFPIRQIDGEK